MHDRPKLFGGTILLVALAAITLGGCGGQSGDSPQSTGGGPRGNRGAEHLAAARNFLDSIGQSDPGQASMQVCYYLNRWIQDCDAPQDWKPDPLLDAVPENLRRSPPMQTLAVREFTVFDVFALREAVWCNALSKWITQQSAPLGTEVWLEQIEAEFGEPVAYELEAAARLFDWTVRNIQLDKLVTADDLTDSEGTSGTSFQPELGIPGPGYTTYPWQTLTFGRGDAWQRARVFIRMARQLDIDVAMLAVSKDDAAEPEPWLTAVLVDGRFYLFDTQLGLPIPGPDGQGIATLAQASQDAGLLKSLDVGSEFVYPVKQTDLKKVVALIDASPEDLSLRMQLLEAQPTADEPLILSVDAARLAERLKTHDLVTDVQLWNVPFQTPLYRPAMEQLAMKTPELMAHVMVEELLFQGIHPLVKGRDCHLRGRFTTEDTQEGALAYYMAARVPNVHIDRMGESADVQESLGLIRGRENDQQWAARLRGHELIVRRTKQNASYWLGLVHWEMAHYDRAFEWFQKHTLDADENGPWTAGARYNLARVYEAQGDLATARETLLLDDSAQKHGNLLRARYLRRQMEDTQDHSESE